MIRTKMPETKIIRKNGGEVKILSLKEGYSNTRQYEKIRAAEEAGFERPEWLAQARKQE